MSEPKPRILVVEDEKHLADGIRENLEVEGYDVDVALDGPAGLSSAQESRFDLILLDVMLPGMDGFTVCETLRDAGDRTPVLFLTARGAPSDRIRGLEAGGDDYLAKPFHLRELLLRVSAILRRGSWYGQVPDQGAVRIVPFIVSSAITKSKNIAIIIKYRQLKHSIYCSPLFAKAVRGDGGTSTNYNQL